MRYLFALIVSTGMLLGSLAAGINRDEIGSATVSGVFVRPESDAWTGAPLELEDVVIPIRVMIENRSKVPLYVRYQHFSLAGRQGEEFVALPPFRIEGEVTEAITPVYPYSGFFVAPYLHPYYPGFAPFDGYFIHDPFYYSLYAPRWIEYKLPTQDMLESALPEGVLKPGGKAMGFLYFDEEAEEASEAADDRIDFHFDLVNATTREQFGRVSIPLEID